MKNLRARRHTGRILTAAVISYTGPSTARRGAHEAPFLAEKLLIADTLSNAPKPRCIQAALIRHTALEERG